MHRLILIIFALFSVANGLGQQKPAETKQINIVYGGNFTKDEARYPGASIFSKDEQQVQFEHEGADLWCDVAIYYQKENTLKAIGNISLQQGDSIKLTSGRIDYDGNNNLAKAWESVILEQNNMTLTTDTLRFDREKQEAYYQDHGTIIDSSNTLTSKIGRYFTQLKKSQFLDSVTLTNPEFNLVSKQLDYYTDTKNAYLYGPSTITGEAYTIYCERGFYDTNIESGYGIKNTRIDYNNRIIYGDSLYFDKKTEFASATNNIKILDTVNNGVIKAHYAEVFKAKDSVFATKKAVSITLVEQDSLYMHGDTLMLTGKPEARILRAFRNAKFYKTDLSGKCDSIHFNQKTGITELITDPVIWSGENQMTGDSIHLLSNVETEKLDSLKVINNAFIISLDTISKTGYNQAKGKNLFGKFIDNDLRYIDLEKNTEFIYYSYNDAQELIGIDKMICSAINMEIIENEIIQLTFITEPDGDLFPEKDLPENSRKLKGFTWRGDERILTKDDIFDEDDLNIELVTIQGIDSPIDRDIDAAEALEQEKARDSLQADTVAVPTPAPIQTQVEELKQPQQEQPQAAPNVTEEAPQALVEEHETIDREKGISPGYYVMIEVLESKAVFKKHLRQLKAQDLAPHHFRRRSNGFYYIYLDRFESLEAAKTAQDQQFKDQFPDSTWILQVRDNR